MNIAERFWAKVSKSDGCWTWTAARDSKGYGMFQIGRRCRRAHRVVWQLVNGPVPDGMHVLHHCDNPPCVRPSHLFLGTNADNVADRESKGRRQGPKGETNGNAKITDQIALEILTSSESQRQAARRLGISKTLVGRIRRGEMWSHVRRATADTPILMRER